MKRILVTGNAGSGKSTLGKAIAHKKGLDYFSLDSIVWQERWEKTPPNERKQKVRALISKDSWVIEGVDYEIMRAADIVIFLDVPRRICFYRTAKRNSRYLFSSRPNLPPNCPEILIVPTLIKIIWRFPKHVRPHIIANKVERNEGSFVHVRSNKQLASYINSLS